MKTVDELRNEWNASADHMNQWDELGIDEIVQFAQQRAFDEVERLQSALAEIREEWAGVEYWEPVYAQEAYAIHLARRMYEIAASALMSNDQVQPRAERSEAK